MLIEST